MRALRGHLGGVRRHPKLQSKVEIPYGWIDYLYHDGPSWNCRPIVRKELLVDGTRGNR